LTTVGAGTIKQIHVDNGTPDNVRFSAVHTTSEDRAKVEWHDHTSGQSTDGADGRDHGCAD